VSVIMVSPSLPNCLGSSSSLQPSNKKVESALRDRICRDRKYIEYILIYYVDEIPIPLSHRIVELPSDNEENSWFRCVDIVNNYECM
jgi:hypothetical protein